MSVEGYSLHASVGQLILSGEDTMKNCLFMGQGEEVGPGGGWTQEEGGPGGGWARRRVDQEEGRPGGE